MLQRIILTVLASLALAATASAQPPADPQDDHGQQVMQKLHDELTAKGFKNVHVMPGSFVVSGTDQQGKPMVMLIGPDAMTVLTPADGADIVQPPQQAQQKDPKLQTWE